MIRKLTEAVLCLVTLLSLSILYYFGLFTDRYATVPVSTFQVLLLWLVPVISIISEFLYMLLADQHILIKRTALLLTVCLFFGSLFSIGILQKEAQFSYRNQYIEIVTLIKNS